MDSGSKVGEGGGPGGKVGGGAWGCLLSIFSNISGPG